MELNSSLPFAESARLLHDELERNGSTLFDMRGEPHLETRYTTPDSEPGVKNDARRQQKNWGWIEAPTPLAHEVPASASPSQLRYFLDGSQRTLPGYFVGSTPIVASIVTAGLLDRNGPAGPELMPGMLATKRAWICPKRSGSDQIDAFVAQAESLGEDVIDPLEELDIERYQDCLSDYPRIEQRAYSAAQKLREGIEVDLTGQWAQNLTRPSGWLLVDGALRQPAPDTVGFVKTYSRQYLEGPIVAELLQLPEGCRSSVIEVDDAWREGRYLVWYLRMRSASGRDPRHGLARVEISVGDNSASVDDVSRWILDERRPSARSDERWATLLYPVHFLERIMQQSLNRETRIWPAAKG